MKRTILSLIGIMLFYASVAQAETAPKVDICLPNSAFYYKLMKIRNDLTIIDLVATIIYPDFYMVWEYRDEGSCWVFKGFEYES